MLSQFNELSPLAPQAEHGRSRLGHPVASVPLVSSVAFFTTAPTNLSSIASAEEGPARFPFWDVELGICVEFGIWNFCALLPL